METCILNHLRAFGLPEVKAFGCNDDYNILIMELLGQSLENLFQARNRKFSLKTTLMLGLFQKIKSTKKNIGILQSMF